MGVAISFKQYAPHLLVDKISGASAGALAAVGLLCDLPLGMIILYGVNCALYSRAFSSRLLLYVHMYATQQKCTINIGPRNLIARKFSPHRLSA